MDFAVGPLVPENPVQCAINKRLAVFPWHADTFGAGWLEFMRESATVVLQLAAGIETKRTCKFVGLAGQLRGGRCYLMQGETMFFCSLKKPGQFTKREAIEDQHRLGMVGFCPPTHEPI